MSWAALVRPALRDAGPYVPGASLDELMARHGLTEVAKLNWNEGLWGPLPGVEKAVTAALGEVWAYPEHAYNALREAIAAETGATPAEVVPGHGIQALIVTLLRAFVRPGDAVVVPELTYGLYAQASHVSGAHVVTVPNRDLDLDLERLAAAAREAEARIVWICDPNNPTGSRVDDREWQALLDGVPDGCLVVADEAYMDYVAPAHQAGRERDVAEGRRVVVLRTFSKIFGLAGLRLGYALAPAALVPFLHAVQEPFNVNRAALAAGLASLGRPEEVAERRALAAAARDRLAAALAGGGVRPLPSAANFVLCDAGVDDDALGERMLEPRRARPHRPGDARPRPHHGRPRARHGPRGGRAARRPRRAAGHRRVIPPALSDEQREIRLVCREFAAREIRPVSLAVDEADTEHPAELWAAAAELGLTSFMLPEALGGGGLTDCLTGCLVQEELSHGCAGIGNLLTSNGFFAEPVLALGTPEQAERWVAPLGAPEPPLTALATTEPDSGSDAASIRTRARAATAATSSPARRPGSPTAGWRGSTSCSPPWSRAAAHRGITAFVLGADDPGLTSGPHAQDGPAGDPQHGAVPGGRRASPPTAGSAPRGGLRGLMRTFDRSRITLGASATGLARAALEYADGLRQAARAVRQADRRAPGGRLPARRHGAPRGRLSPAGLARRRARRDAGERVTMEAAMAKLHASETAMWCTWAAVQTLGGWGYSREYPVEKWMRDAKLEEIEEGTSDIQRLVIARGLLR